MASRPDTKHAVTIVPKQGASVLIICETQGAASGLQSSINDNSDAQAKVEGPVYELPMVVSGSSALIPADVEGLFRRDFGRVFQPARRLLELRDLAAKGGERSGEDYWTATALWTFPDVPAAVVVPIEEV